MSARKVEIRLLGEFLIQYDQQPLGTFSSSRLQALLVYLLIHHDIPQARNHLAYQFWPDSTESSARNNLRQLIYQLRQALPEPDRFLAVDGTSLAWKFDKDQVIDLVEFERCHEKASAAEKQQNQELQRYALEQLTQFYHGDLLPGCYDDWIVPDRERVRAMAVTAYQKLISLQELQRDYPAAIQSGQTLLRLDPLDESSYLLLIRLYLHHKNKSGAMRMYQAACEMLEREFATQPGPELQEAYHRIQQKEPAGSQRRTAPPPDGHSLVGRQAEWREMMNIWQRVENGSAEMLILSGEAGIGKTHLAEEMVLWANQRGVITARARAYSIEGQLSLAPVMEWLRSSYFQSAFASMEPTWLMELFRLIPDLHAHYPDLHTPPPISEYGQRQHFFEALARAILYPRQPTILLLDDLQWCDQETVEWLHFLLRYDRQAPLLILASMRIEEVPPGVARLTQQLSASGQLKTLALQALDASETAKLANQTVGKELQLPVALRLYKETEGNPLFIIEMLQSGFEEQVSKDEAAAEEGNHAITLPPRVQAVILQRLSQLSDQAKHIAEIGAIYGQPIHLDLLLQMQPNEEDKLVSALDELWQKHIVHEQAANIYSFTHDKLREVAYGMVSPPQRRLLHRRIALALETLNAENLEPVSGQIAAHYDQAGTADQAVPYYLQAGSKAAGVYANDDAIALLNRGLALIPQIPAGTQRDLQELALQFAIATLYRLTKGWATPALGQALNRALTLCDQVGTPAQRAQILYGLQSMYVVEGRLEEVRSSYEEMHRLFIQTQGSQPEFATLMYTGALLHMGNFSQARQAFEVMIASQDAEQIKNLQESHGVNYLAHGCVWNAHALFFLGFSDSALRSAEKGVQIAKDYTQPFNQALTVTYLATLQELRADLPAFIQQAEQALVLAEESRAPYYQSWAQILVQFAYASDQVSDTHLTRLEDAIHSFVSSGARLRLPYFLSLLARMYRKAGKFEQALSIIEQSMIEARQNNEHCWDAELYRLRGELLSLLDLGGAESELLHAVEAARAQQALGIELRAAVSLTQLWFAQKRYEKGRQLLRPILDRFSEGQWMPEFQYANSLSTAAE